MAEFELSIYGNDDEILKTYETSKVRWGVLLQAAQMQDVIEEKDVVKQFEQIGDFIKKLFPDLTDEDLQKADYEDVVNTFKQLMNKANKIGAGSAKNA